MVRQYYFEMVHKTETETYKGLDRITRILKFVLFVLPF